MRATLTEEQTSVHEVARDLAGDLTGARAVTDGGGRPAEPTSALVDGFGSLGYPERLGGSGGGLVEVALVSEALGQRVVPSPVVPHLAALQTAAISDLPFDPASGQLLTLAVSEGTQAGLGPYRTQIGPDRVRGSKTGIVHDEAVSHAVVVGAADRVALAALDNPVARASLDPTRPLVDVAFDVAPDATADGDGGVLDGAVVVAAADLCGAARGAVELAAGYAGDREQFGRPIGQFQGVAHQLADAIVGIESAWSLVLYAAWAVDEDAPDRREAVHAAKSRAGEAAVFAAERALQVHGGIGVTWEADAHLFLRRALGGSAWLGSSRWHAIELGRRRLAAVDG